MRSVSFGCARKSSEAFKRIHTSIFTHPVHIETNQIIGPFGVSFAPTGDATSARIPRPLDTNTPLAARMCEKDIATLLDLFWPTTLTAANISIKSSPCFQVQKRDMANQCASTGAPEVSTFVSPTMHVDYQAGLGCVEGRGHVEMVFLFTCFGKNSLAIALLN